MPRPKSDPAYRLHRQSGQAIVTLPDPTGHRHDVLLGPYDTPQSRAKYDTVVAEWKVNGHRPPAPVATPADLTVNELILAYWQYVQGYYVKDGKPTSEVETIRQALRHVRRLYGPIASKDFGPLALKAVRQAMVEQLITRTVKVKDLDTGEVREETKVIRHGLARKHINKQVGRIKRMYSWAVEEELVPASAYAALDHVKGLKRGKSAAREKPRIKPVSADCVDAVLPLVPGAVRAMIEVQRLCSCRPQEIVSIRPIDLDTSGPVWEYRPARYKTEHHNEDDDPDRERVIFLGPKAQALLKPFLPLNVTEYLFSPKRSEEERRAKQRAKRQTPLWPSHVAHQEKRRKKRARAPLRDGYDVASYRRAIRRACLKAGIPLWHPNQLRHSGLTEIRKRYGLEASKACGGHQEIAVTQIYAEADHDAARKVMREIG